MKLVVACLPAALLIVLASGTVPAVAGSRPSPAAQACAAGLAALNAGSLGPAMKTYNSVVPASAACAKAGRAAAGDLLTARALIKAGYTADALTYVEKALDAEPTLAISSDVLPPTVGLQGRALAERLERNGFPVQARQVLHQVIQDDAGIPLDSYDRTILGETRPPWYSRAAHFLLNPIVPTVLVAVLVLLLLAGGLLARLRRRLHFQPFTVGDGATAGPEAAGTLRMLIRRELHRLAEEDARLGDRRRLRLDQAGPYEDRFDLGPVLDGMSSPWKPVAAASGILVKALPAKARLISGTVLPGDSVVLEISTVHGVAKKMCEIIHSEFDFPPSRQDVLHQLALPSAAWIALAHFPEARLGGTRDWRSYVAFAAGCAWQAHGDLGRARACYIHACDNPDNLAARINLAALDQNADYAAAPANPTVLVSYQRLSDLVRDTAHMTGDLQWYRTRYLLSAGLRDILDLAPDGAGDVAPVPSANGHRRPAVPDRHDPDGPTPGETLIQFSLRLAVQLALQLEREISAPGDLPEAFVAYGRAAALTLVASQVRRKTDKLKEVLVEPGDRPDYNDGGAVRQALAGVLRDVPEDGVAERLVDFARAYCPLDDQAYYNLYRYHRTRAKILETAIDGWYRERPPRGPGERSARRSDIDDLKARYEVELAQMKVSAQQVNRVGDPALIARVEAVSTLDPQPGNGRWRMAEESFQWEQPPDAVPPLDDSIWGYGGPSESQPDGFNGPPASGPDRSGEWPGRYTPRHNQPDSAEGNRLNLPGEDGTDEDRDPGESGEGDSPMG